MRRVSAWSLLALSTLVGVTSVYLLLFEVWIAAHPLYDSPARRIRFYRRLVITAWTESFGWRLLGHYAGLKLVDEVTDFCEGAVAQIHAQQPRSVGAAQALFKTLEDIPRQIGLLPKHVQQRSAIGWVLVVARQTARRANCERERNRSCT